MGAYYFQATGLLGSCQHTHRQPIRILGTQLSTMARAQCDSTALSHAGTATCKSATSKQPAWSTPMRSKRSSEGERKTATQGQRSFRFGWDERLGCVHGPSRLPRREKMQVQRLPRAFSAASRPAPVARKVLTVCNSAVAKPASIPYKGADGSDKGTQQLALKVAEDTAKAVVHRYMVLVNQNARRVSQAAWSGPWCCCWVAHRVVAATKLGSTRSHFSAPWPRIAAIQRVCMCCSRRRVLPAP